MTHSKTIHDRAMHRSSALPSRPTTSPTTKRPIHVVHVIGTLDRGGAETLSLDICRAISPTEIQQTFITLGGQEGSLANEFREAGASVLQCPLKPSFSFPLRLWRCLRTLHPDVVVSHVSLFTSVVLLIARAAGVPTRIARMWSEGDGRPDTFPRLAFRSLLRKLLPWVSTQVVAVSQAALAFAGRRAARDGKILYNSVDIARVEGWDRATARRKWNLPDEVPVIAYIGRASPEKNRPFLVDIHRAAKQVLPETRLLIVGPFGVDDILTAHPEVRNDPSVILGGEVDEIASVLASADVFVLPSLWEGLPGVVLEALAVGLPVVATDLPCLSEASGYVKGLTLLKLSEGGFAWGTAAAKSTGTSLEERNDIRASFASSPFQTNHAVAQWRLLWENPQE